MNIGIIGSGALGANFARILARNGLSAVISNSRGPASLQELVRELGPHIRAGTLEEAARADIVLAAIRWVDAERVLRGLPHWRGRVLIDATNPVEFIEPGSPDAQDPNNPLAAYGIKAVDLGGRPSSDIIRQCAPGAHVVKAFNHLDVNVLQQPEVAGGKRVLFYSGDDAAAKAQVRQLIESTGFFPVDLGSLEVGGHLASLPFGALSAHHFVKL
ncbi:MAG: NADPH-dependent F420 reductase [Burkholderiales bacterium]|nr:NADPH-dependent F420 reductase [Burkholderiales bacterium]MBH2015436.1 NADPH-dependent F420 reductase [Burkholderiales bacterium]